MVVEGGFTQLQTLCSLCLTNLPRSKPYDFCPQGDTLERPVPVPELPSSGRRWEGQGNTQQTLRAPVEENTLDSDPRC